jgi:1-acyl-sn-glycerol-3-phosphate acyltransferase
VSVRAILDGCARWAASATVSAFYAPLIVGAALVSRSAAHRMAQRWSRAQLRVFGIVLDVTCDHPLDDRRGYVFALLNQTSLIEWFLSPVAMPRPTRTVINLEFAFFPFVGQFAIVLGSTVIVRQWPSQAKRALERAVRQLKQGECFVISFEGRRSPDGHVSRYKKGPVVLAIEAQADLVPFYIDGARDVWPYGAWVPRPGRIRTVFLHPIRVAGLSYADRDALLATVRHLAEALLTERPAPPATVPTEHGGSVVKESDCDSE